MSATYKTLPSQLCGESALELLPQLDQYKPGEVRILGEHLVAIDAWGGASMRCLIEYLGRYRQGRVTLSPCGDVATWHLLHALVRKNHPAHLVLPNDLPDDKKDEEVPVPPEVLLQAEPMPSVERAEQAAKELFGAAEGKLVKPARFVAKYLPELVSNSLQHAKRSAVHPVACAYHDVEDSVLQLVVVDLGEHFPDQKSLSNRVSKAQAGGLLTLVAQAKESKFDMSLSVASGTGRIRWRNGSLQKATSRAKEVRGFCAAITVPI